MSASRMASPVLIFIGLIGFMVTIWMALVEAPSMGDNWNAPESVSYTHLRAHET